MARFLPLLALAGCIPITPMAPTAGYGDPYRGTGKPIYLKDSRTDWEISEGGTKVSSEQALEASGDQEYETRRQLAKRHNHALYEEGKAHRRRGHIMMGAGIGMAVAGFLLSAIVPKGLQDVMTSPADLAMPESRTTMSGSATNAAALGAFSLLAVGVGALAYGYLGGRKAPPYVPWHTPDALNRPAYIREHTEEYNEKIGAPAATAQPGGVDDLAPAPGQRHAAPARPTKGGRR